MPHWAYSCRTWIKHGVSSGRQRTSRSAHAKDKHRSDTVVTLFFLSHPGISVSSILFIYPYDVVVKFVFRNHVRRLPVSCRKVPIKPLVGGPSVKCILVRGGVRRKVRLMRKRQRGSSSCVNVGVSTFILHSSAAWQSRDVPLPRAGGDMNLWATEIAPVSARVECRLCALLRTEVTVAAPFFAWHFRTLEWTK